MVFNGEYREYDAWLQPGTGVPMTGMKLIVKKGVSKFAARECRSEVQRLYGRDIWSKKAAFTVTIGLDAGLAPEGYRLTGSDSGIEVAGADQNGVLYGIYAFIMHLRAGNPPSSIQEETAPAVERRIINHWDNMAGTIERGYAGRSIFFKDGALSYDADRIRDYARLLASVGINQISINNVNITKQSMRLLTPELLPKVAKLADIFRPFGIRLILSVHFDSPVILGGLSTADPLDDKAAQWWREAVQAIYRHVPDLAGFLIKADSEFQGGPAALGRTQADGANVIARALKPYGGTLYWRCFVYDCMQDWRDTKTDRPKAAYEYFYPLDGAFDQNVVLQIKNGPVDFQVREPHSPLLCAMKRTRLGIEFQATQEYTGQQIDLYALAVQWEEIFSSPVTDTRVMHDLLGREIDSIAAVANVGDDPNWTGHTLAQCNLYAFGRLAWDPSLKAREIIESWIRLTFGSNPRLLGPLTEMMLASREVYEKYHAPLGIGWMVSNIDHYGPNVDSYEYSKWGIYHRADQKAIGVDRTKKGTAYTAQYHPYLAAIYDNVKTCPENLLLFFHRLPYSFKLKSGKTLLQHIYDTHFEGVEDVIGFIEIWESLKAYLPESAYQSVLDRLHRQLQNAEEWRDVINTYFYRKTGIPDEKGRTIFGMGGCIYGDQPRLENAQ
jgi:alpha-glucuronidase